jgi:hypothetical protein
MKQRRAPSRRWSRQPRRAACDSTEALACAIQIVKANRADLMMKQEERDKQLALDLRHMWDKTPPESREYWLTKRLIPQARAGDSVVDDVLCEVAAELKQYGHPVPEALQYYVIVQRRQGLPSGRTISPAQRRRELDSVGLQQLAGSRGPNPSAHKTRDAIVVGILAKLHDAYGIPPTTRGLDIVLQAFEENNVPLTRRGATTAWKGRS